MPEVKSTYLALSSFDVCMLASHICMGKLHLCLYSISHIWVRLIITVSTWIAIGCKLHGNFHHKTSSPMKLL